MSRAPAKSSLSWDREAMPSKLDVHCPAQPRWACIGAGWSYQLVDQSQATTVQITSIIPDWEDQSDNVGWTEERPLS